MRVLVAGMAAAILVVSVPEAVTAQDRDRDPRYVEQDARHRNGGERDRKRGKAERRQERRRDARARRDPRHPANRRGTVRYDPRHPDRGYVNSAPRHRRHAHPRPHRRGLLDGLLYRLKHDLHGHDGHYRRKHARHHRKLHRKHERFHRKHDGHYRSHRRSHGRGHYRHHRGYYDGRVILFHRPYRYGVHHGPLDHAALVDVLGYAMLEYLTYDVLGLGPGYDGHLTGRWYDARYDPHDYAAHYEAGYRGYEAQDAVALQLFVDGERYAELTDFDRDGRVDLVLTRS